MVLRRSDEEFVAWFRRWLVANNVLPKPNRRVVVERLRVALGGGDENSEMV